MIDSSIDGIVNWGEESSVIQTVMDGESMLNTLDEGLQWLVLLKIYGEEIWVLPLAAAAIFATKGRTWAMPVRIALLLLLLMYVVVFRMHWHSWLAVPILALAIASDVARDHWYRLFGGLRTVLTDATDVSSSGGQRRRRLLLLLLQIAAIVAAFIYFDAPGDLWAIGFTTLALAGFLGVLPGWRRLAESRFQRQLRHDPRLGRYLDWVRWTRMRAPEDRRSLLADNWIVQVRSHAQPRGIRLWLARCLVRQRRMMTIESAFVVQNLRRERARAWQALQIALHGRPGDPSQTVSQPAAPISEVLTSQNGQTALSNWLAMTEALAECVAFVSDRASDQANERPQWLVASELLSHAGEVEQEIALDLKREARLSRAAPASDARRQIAEHHARALRYFDLAACCIENQLAPGSGVPGEPLDVRWRRFIGDGTALRPQPTQAPNVAEETFWRIVLALRYHLLDALSPQKSDVPNVRYMVGQFRTDIGDKPPVRLLAAALARDAAESNLWISGHQGDPGSRWVFDDRRLWVDRLKQLDYWRVQVGPGAFADDEHIMAESALRRVVHLWGLAIEQDLDFLRPGTEIWRDRLESAADFFICEGSLRLRRLAALAEQQPQVTPALHQIVEFV